MHDGTAMHSGGPAGRHRTFLTTLTTVILIGVLSGCSAGEPQAPTQEVKSRAAAYTNPVFEPKSSIPAEASDPMALKYNGEYYVYVTGGACGVLHSTDLVTWEYLGPVVSETASCWAPDVVYQNGTFYMYASTTLWGEIERDRRVRLYTATRPEGPFTYASDVTDHYSYDGHYFQASDGKEYLFWTRECGGGIFPCSGNPNLVDNLTNMRELSGKPSLVATPLDWECAGRCIFEAPQVLERDGRFYQLYSAGAYENEAYGSGYARADAPKGPGGVEDHSWRKMNQLLGSVPNQVSGPGGSSWVKGPGNLEDWIVYHGRNKNQTGGLARWLRIDSVMWGVDQLWMPGAPTYTAQPGPAMPRVHDLFRRAVDAGLSEGWKLEGGQWAVKDGHASQAGTTGEARALAGDAATHYALEANVRFTAPSSGEAGVYAYYADENNWVKVVVRAADRTLVVRVKVAGTEQPEAVHKLPAQTRPDVFHQLLVRKNHDRFAFSFDHLPVADVSLAFTQPGVGGLLTRDAGAEFAGFAFAHGWEDFFGRGPAQSNLLAGWGAAADGAKAAGEWAVKNGALYQQNPKGINRIFKGSRDWGSYQVTATVQPINPKSMGQVGLYAGYWDERNNVMSLLDPAGGQLVIRAVLNGKKEKDVSIKLGDKFKGGLDFTKPHTLRVAKNGFTFRFMLDGVVVAERQISLSQGQPGLITEDGVASFDSVQVTRWD